MNKRIFQWFLVLLGTFGWWIMLRFSYSYDYKSFIEVGSLWGWFYLLSIIWKLAPRNKQEVPEK